jgi:hypothetical protein
VRLGNLQYDTHVVRCEATLGLLPAVNSARVTFPQAVEVEASAGDPASLYLDGGEGAATVLTGSMLGVARSFTGTTAVLGDAGAALAALRPAVTYERQQAADVIRALCGDAGADAGSLDAALDLPAYVAHQGRTAAEHAATLAGWAGSLAAVDGEGRLQVAARPAAPELALRYGREFIDYRVYEVAAPTASRVLVGAGPAGSGSAPNALQETVDPLPAGAPKAGAGALWRATPALRTPSAATMAGTAADTAAAAASRRLVARCWLLPALRPGVAVEVQDLPGGLGGGSWLVTRVRHEVTPDTGGSTVVEAVAGGAGLSSLLGTALGALGGLL